MRWIFRLIGAVVVMAAIALGALALLPSGRIAQIAADQLTRATGRAVTLSGDTTLSLYPILGVSTGAVEVANADWSEAGPMLRAESLKIGVAPLPLLRGEIRITGLEIAEPRIRLERAADGRVNWNLGVDGVAPSGQSDGAGPATSRRLALTLDRALIRGASLSYIDHGQGSVHEIRDMDFDLRWPDYEGRATFKAVLRQVEVPVTVTGHVDRLGAFLDGTVTPVAASIDGPRGRAAFDGRAGVAPQAQGQLDLDMTDTGAFMAALGLGEVAMPEGLGRRAEGRAGVTLTEAMQISVREMALDLGRNAISGAADIDLSGAVPRVDAQLKAGALDLSSLAGGSGGGGGGGGDGNDGWSRAPIDASALGLANGEVVLSADSIDLGDLSLGASRLAITVERSRAVVGLREMRAYGGQVSGQVVANNRSGLSVGGDLTAEGIDLERFLADVMNITRFSAPGSGAVQFLGVGQSVHAIMNSLSGEGRIGTGRGVISGLDLDRLMRSGDVTGGTTVFDEMTASFTMEDGNLYNRDLVMRLPLARATGSGRIGLGARDIDYLFTPALLDGETTRGVAIPVRIRGVWADPRITPDLEKAIEINLGEEREKLESEAEQRLDREIRERLDLEAREGQSLEDALRDKLEDGANRALRKLFD
ncbi:AsmA family protein [Roseovarius sp. D22-M7]|uniref:AsmA family protein n=1 Tax=Roseovarius sp. D22-M7 TaxID=3127116 RepID=UPI00301056C6